MNHADQAHRRGRNGCWHPQWQVMVPVWVRISFRPAATHQASRAEVSLDGLVDLALQLHPASPDSPTNTLPFPVADQVDSTHRFLDRLLRRRRVEKAGLHLSFIVALSCSRYVDGGFTVDSRSTCGLWYPALRGYGITTL